MCERAHAHVCPYVCTARLRARASVCMCVCVCARVCVCGVRVRVHVCAACARVWAAWVWADVYKTAAALTIPSRLHTKIPTVEAV